MSVHIAFNYHNDVVYPLPRNRMSPRESELKLQQAGLLVINKPCIDREIIAVFQFSNFFSAFVYFVVNPDTHVNKRIFRDI
jgi:hypothetical protein